MTSSRAPLPEGSDVERGLPCHPTATHPVLQKHEVHIWCTTLDRPRSEVQHLQKMLSADEHAKATRLRHPEDRDRLIIARGLLRVMLGHYLDREPTHVHFHYGLNGKPELAGESEIDIVRFSLSHSHGRALYAFARGREVGVDLEELHPHPTDEQIAQHYFSPGENETLRNLPPGDRHRAFLRFWTRREAYLKARGDSLAVLPKLASLSLVPGEPVGRAEADEGSQQPPRWFLMELDLGPAYVAALVMEGQGCPLVCGQWP